jgi:hypothetical protein
VELKYETRYSWYSYPQKDSCIMEEILSQSMISVTDYDRENVAANVSVTVFDGRNIAANVSVTVCHVRERGWCR